MKILVLNTRVHSIDFDVFEMPGEEKLCGGVIEKVGLDTALVTYKCRGMTEEIMAIESILDHKAAVDAIIRIIITTEHKIINSSDEIAAVGHRIIHGGEKYFKSALIDEEVKKEIRNNFELAPLHNPYNLKGIEEIEQLLPGKPQVAVFDTAFHQTLNEVAYRYPISENVYQKFKMRKYGFHGISHRHVAERAAILLKKPLNKTNIISLHLGQGSSLCAVKNGVSADTSMGFTPLDGVMMMTRSGTISPGVIFHLLKEGWRIQDIDALLNRESGLLGIAGVSDEMLDNVKEMLSGNKKAKLAIDMFVYRLREYLGSYYFLFKKLDAICFTGGIGENSDVIRKMVCAELEHLGIKLDSTKNKKFNGKEAAINKPGSKIKIFVIPRDEKIIIARDTYKLVEGL
ncbi:MAG: acetate kinase [Elusimicrobiota bacterium]